MICSAGEGSHPAYRRMGPTHCELPSPGQVREGYWITENLAMVFAIPSVMPVMPRCKVY